jgi:hypothetical protein
MHKLWERVAKYSMRDQRSAYSHSHLFTVRLWAEDTGGAGSEMRGEVRHVQGGGVRYFEDWTTLIAYLAAKMQELQESQQEMMQSLVVPVVEGVCYDACRER